MATLISSTSGLCQTTPGSAAGFIKALPFALTEPQRNSSTQSLSPKQESGFLNSPVPQPLAVLIYTRKVAPSLHFVCVCVQSNYLLLFQFILQRPLALLHWTQEAQLSTNWPQPVKVACSGHLALNDMECLSHGTAQTLFSRKGLVAGSSFPAMISGQDTGPF